MLILSACIRMQGDASGTCTDYTAPARPEDAELVCKLMATAGRQLDAGAKNAGAMDAYFACLEQWSRSPGLESRLRFMLKVGVQLTRSPDRASCLSTASKLPECRSLPLNIAGLPHGFCHSKPQPSLAAAMMLADLSFIMPARTT